MKKTTTWMVAVMVIAGLSMASLAFAQPGQGAGQGGQGKGQGMAALNLTEEQHKQIDDLKMKHIKESMSLRTDLAIKEMELGALWRAEDLDGKKIIAKVKEISGLREKLQVAGVQHKLDMYKVFTPDQRKAARRFLMGRHGMFGRGRGHRGMRGMGRGMHGMRGPGMGQGMGKGMHGQGRGMGQGKAGGGCGGDCGGDCHDAPEPPPPPEGD